MEKGNGRKMEKNKDSTQTTHEKKEHLKRWAPHKDTESDTHEKDTHTLM